MLSQELANLLENLLIYPDYFKAINIEFECPTCKNKTKFDIWTEEDYCSYIIFIECEECGYKENKHEWK